MADGGGVGCASLNARSRGPQNACTTHCLSKAATNRGKLDTLKLEHAGNAG